MIHFQQLSPEEYNKELEDLGFHQVTEENKNSIIQLFDKYKDAPSFVEFMDYYYKDEENEYDDKIASLYCGTLRNQDDQDFINERQVLFAMFEYAPEQCWIVQSNNSKQWYLVIR